ncbi:crossover junction endonuclease MUS81 [Epargyreus clarus]|uniref:crossover junction endonuclease MUS81 n=1 Tax=Epargyreus clarus TaxID=520877 RepID=UPI003C2CFCAC
MADNCVVNAKPVTLKRSRPNPIFQEWLEELLEEAKRKRCKLEHQLTEALTSLSKYPLPLNSGAECRILKGFDSRLCDFIEQRLKTHNVHCTSPNRHNFEFSSNVSETDLQLNTDKYKKYMARLISYSSILIALKRINGKDMLPIQMVLNQALEETHTTVNKLLTSKLILSKCPQTLQPLQNLVRIDPHTEKCVLTNLGITEACHLHNLLNKYNHDVVNSSTQTDTITPVNISDTTNEDVTTIQMEAGCYDVILLIDKNETSGCSNKNDVTVSLFKQYKDLKHEYRSLKVGDFAWIARHKVHENQELVLPYIVERKRLDDLSASIKDGRFHEQKFRLRRCGLENVIYLVESYASKKYLGLPIQSLMQALANTRVQDGFKVHMTDSLHNSARFLAMMTKRLTIEYRNKTLKGRNSESDNGILMTFEFFNKMSLKNKPLTVTETFIKLLLQLKGLSVEKALAITKVYKTPKSLIKAYEYLEKEDGEILLTNLKYGDLNRNVGPVVSKTVYQLFSSFDIS